MRYAIEIIASAGVMRQNQVANWEKKMPMSLWDKYHSESIDVLREKARQYELQAKHLINKANEIYTYLAAVDAFATLAQAEFVIQQAKIHPEKYRMPEHQEIHDKGLTCPTCKS